MRQDAAFRNDLNLRNIFNYTVVGKNDVSGRAYVSKHIYSTNIIIILYRKKKTINTV